MMSCLAACAHFDCKRVAACGAQKAQLQRRMPGSNRYAIVHCGADVAVTERGPKAFMPAAVLFAVP